MNDDGSPTPPPIPENVYQAPTTSSVTAPQPDTGMGQDAGMRLLLPVGRSGWAIAAGYCGLFALIGIGAPFALIFGILGVRDIKKSQATDRPKHGMGRAVFGIIIGAIVTLLIAVSLVLPLL